MIEPLWRTVWRVLEKPRNKMTLRADSPTSGHEP